jgi:prepilin-type N-terminal cleavage/methylation domain-containing protein
MKTSLRASVPSRQSGSSRQGFSLIEVIVSMVLLAICVSSLAALTHSISQSSIKVTGAAYRNGVLMHEVNRLIALPYDSVAVGTMSYEATTGPYPHTRLITVLEPVPAKVKAVKIVITPTNPLYKPDTLNFTRTNARTSKVLCTICNDKP